MRIFAHRGLWQAPSDENSLVALEAALKAGFDIETDIRIRAEEFVIKHDLPDANEQLPFLDDIVQLMRQYPKQQAALHFKYDDWKQSGALEIGKHISSVAERIFIFDASIEFNRQLKKQYPVIRLGVSVGDKHYHDAFATLSQALSEPAIDVIWADEYRHFYSEELITACHEHNKVVYCVSPDIASAVQHPRAKVGYEQTWSALLEWGADGICTDHSVALQALCNSFSRLKTKSAVT